MSNQTTKVKRYKMFFENHPVWSKIILISSVIICLGLVLGSVDNIVSISKKYASFFKQTSDIHQPQKKLTAEAIQKQESNKIYQDNKVVGEITGKMKIDGDHIFFEELSETSNLKRDMPFEYQEVKYTIVEIKKEIREYMSMQRKKEFVLKNVLCKKFK